MASGTKVTFFLPGFFLLLPGLRLINSMKGLDFEDMGVLDVLSSEALGTAGQHREHAPLAALCVSPSFHGQTS